MIFSNGYYFISYDILLGKKYADYVNIILDNINYKIFAELNVYIIMQFYLLASYNTIFIEKNCWENLILLKGNRGKSSLAELKILKDFVGRKRFLNASSPRRESNTPIDIPSTYYPR